MREEFFNVDSEDEDYLRSFGGRRLYTIEEVDEETTQCRIDVSSVNLTTRITLNSNPYQACAIAQPTNQLDLEIGDKRIPRFCCACHKIHNVIQAATTQHQEFSNILQEINTASKRIRNCIVVNAPFRYKKCRLRCLNVTRWSSAFMMLEAVLRAFNKKMLSNEALSENCFPIPLKTVEIYYQVLIEAHESSLDFQKMGASIGYVIPRK